MHSLHKPTVTPFTCKLYSCSFHLSVSIDVAVAAVLGVFTTALKLLPKFRANGGSLRENLALQNVQVPYSHNYSEISVSRT